MKMESENKPIVLPEFKYYKGEEEDPFPEDDIRRKFWWGEMMFSRLHNLEEQFKGYEKKMWLDGASIYWNTNRIMQFVS